MLGFLTARPPLAGTQDAQLPAPLTTQILYSQEQPLPADEEAKEPTLEPVQEVIDKDFKVFYHQDAPSTSHPTPRLTQTSSSQEEAHTTEGMGFEEKTPNLMALLKAHVGSASPVVPRMPVAPRPPTPALGRASFNDIAAKKRKRDQESKDLEDAEVTHSS